MSIQYSTAVRDARQDAVETAIGTSPKLRIYTGSKPANCAASATGTMLVEMALPSDWLNASSGGVKTLNGTWSGIAVAAGIAGYFRIWNNGATVCHEQGTVSSASAGTGDLQLDNDNIAVSQTVVVTTHQTTDGNA